MCLCKLASSSKKDKLGAPKEPGKMDSKVTWRTNSNSELHKYKPLVSSVLGFQIHLCEIALPLCVFSFAALPPVGSHFYDLQGPMEYT